MTRLLVSALACVCLFATSAAAQQQFPLPDIRSMKHLTTKESDRARDIPGKETVMDFYSTPNGQILTLYSYRGRKVAFSTHRNNDVQGTYRLFMDVDGNGLFREIDRNAQWQIPMWAR